jgi:hypothetical protein
VIYLSKGSRITLIKSMLSNLLIYVLSIFPIPVGVANHIKKLQRDILWGGVSDEFKFHLVSWTKICTRFYLGVLGIRNLLFFNQALLRKWLWRCATKKEDLRRSVVEFKYDWILWAWGAEKH